MQLILFGAGFFGQKAYSFFGDENVFCFCDNAVQNDEVRTVCGKKVISFDTLMKIHHEYIIVVCLKLDFCLEVCKQLDDAGVEDYLEYGMFAKCEKTPHELSRMFQDKSEVNRLYKECYRYLAGRIRGQLQYLKRHVDITTLKPATGELRKRQYTLLEHVADFFEFISELDIKPFLTFGNLIGAVRHQGFIPWDDDLDFGLIRSDCDKLLEFAQEKCAVLILNDNIWVDTNGNLIEDNELHKVYPGKYIFNLRPDVIQIYKCTERGRYYVMDAWVYDFYKNEYDIRDHLKWLKEINEEVEKKDSNTSKVEFLRNAYKSNSMISREMTDNFFPGIDNLYGYPGEPSKDFDSWIPTRDIFPLRKVKYENTSFWAPNNMETLLRYEYKDYMEFPEDMGIITHNADGAEAE